MDEQHDDTVWMLREAAKPSGFTPHEASVAFAMSLEHLGLLRESKRGPTWNITPLGRDVLEKLERERHP